MNLITNGWKSQVTLRYGKLVYFATTTKKHCHCQFYIFSKLGHEIFNCHSFDSFFTHFCIPVVQGWLFNPKTQWFCFTHWSSIEIVSTIERQGTQWYLLWLLKEGFLGDCKIIWPSQLSWWCELATVESFYGWYFVSSFNSDKGSMLKKSVLETWDQYQYLGNCSPTPPLTQQQSIDNNLRLMLS